MITKKIWGKLFKGSGWAVFTMFVWELVEEGLEQLIAVAISGAVTLFVTKALSTLAIITATQGIKMAFKHSMIPLIKSFTYKKGNDKMNLIKKFFKWIFANKKSLIGTISAGFAVASGSGIIDVSNFDAIVLGGINITPYLYYIALGIMILIGVFGKGFESVQAFFDRIKSIKETKAETQVLKQAKKELKDESKAETIDAKEQEKINQKLQSKLEKEQEKQKQAAEFRAKVDAIKEQLKAEQSAQN